jgi:hypothetical protein
MKTYQKVIRTPVEKVMHVLSIDAKQASEVLDYMQIDFSECTNLEFAREAKFSYEMINLKRNPKKYQKWLDEMKAKARAAA